MPDVRNKGDELFESLTFVSLQESYTLEFFKKIQNDFMQLDIGEKLGE